MKHSVCNGSTVFLFGAAGCFVGRVTNICRPAYFTVTAGLLRRLQPLSVEEEDLARNISNDTLEVLLVMNL